jgi:VanZ family protein
MTPSGRRRRDGLAVLIASAILALSVVPLPAAGPTTGPAGLPIDRWLHALAYAGLTLALAGPARARTRRPLLAAALLAVAYGGAIEGLQAGLAYRTGSAVDVGANALGAAVGTAIAVGHRRLW